MAEPRRYAEGTTVPVEKTQEQIRKLLTDHGATQTVFASDSEKGLDVLVFRLEDRMLRFELHHPDPADFAKTDKGSKRTPKQIETLVAREYRRRWRARLLITKAKLELIASGDADFDAEFMSDLLLPNGDTVAMAMLPAIASAYERGVMPDLPLLGSG